MKVDPKFENDKSRFLKACRRERVDSTPVWFMRQAGRYLPEYRKIRERYSLLEICRTSELAVEVTLQPLRRFRLDAAIIFADILLPLQALGVDFDFARGEGPVLHRTIGSLSDVESLRVFEPREELSFVLEALAQVRRELHPGVALIGFAGAPFTVASYLIEGGHSRNFLATKMLMYREPRTWGLLMEKLAAMTAEYLKAQVEAGAQAVQLFDSWVGCLAPDDYRQRVLPYSKEVFEKLKPLGVPAIHFGTGTSALLELMKEAGASVVGVDWRLPLGDAWERLGWEVAVQGNLDPAALFGPQDALCRKVEAILDEAAGRPGHVFNLGHGVLPQTPVESVQRVVETVRARRFTRLPGATYG